MHYVILVSQTGQQTYDDSERHYTYPARYNAALAPLMAGVFRNRGDRALVFRGGDGLDELTTTEHSRLW